MRTDISDKNASEMPIQIWTSDDSELYIYDPNLDIVDDSSSEDYLWYTSLCYISHLQHWTKQYLE